MLDSSSPPSELSSTNNEALQLLHPKSPLVVRLDDPRDLSFLEKIGVSCLQELALDFFNSKISAGSKRELKKQLNSLGLPLSFRNIPFLVILVSSIESAEDAQKALLLIRGLMEIFSHKKSEVAIPVVEGQLWDFIRKPMSTAEHQPNEILSAKLSNDFSQDRAPGTSDNAYDILAVKAADFQRQGNFKAARQTREVIKEMRRLQISLDGSPGSPSRKERREYCDKDSYRLGTRKSGHGDSRTTMASEHSRFRRTLYGNGAQDLSTPKKIMLGLGLLLISPLILAILLIKKFFDCTSSIYYLLRDTKLFRKDIARASKIARYLAIIPVVLAILLLAGTIVTAILYCTMSLDGVFIKALSINAEALLSYVLYVASPLTILVSVLALLGMGFMAVSLSEVISECCAHITEPYEEAVRGIFSSPGSDMKEFLKKAKDEQREMVKRVLQNSLDHTKEDGGRSESFVNSNQPKGSESDRQVAPPEVLGGVAVAAVQNTPDQVDLVVSAYQRHSCGKFLQDLQKDREAEGSAAVRLHTY